MPALQREAAWAQDKLLGDLRQAVPQDGRIRLHIIDAESSKSLVGPLLCHLQTQN